MNIFLIVIILLLTPFIINNSGIPMYRDENGTYREVITPYHPFQQLLTSAQQTAYGSSAWLDEQRECTDIWQETHNETLYYQCWAVLDKDLEQ